MLVAEELECDWSKVRAEYASAHDQLIRNRVYVSTGGSRSVRQSHEYLRQAGATAREMLVAAAAEHWGVPASDCRAAHGTITHEPSGRKTTFGGVATEASKHQPPTQLTLKDPSQWKLIGKSVKRLDTAQKVLGAPVFGTDVQLPGMLYAAIRACPVFGGKVASYQEGAITDRAGVRRVVSLGDAVAVVAETTWQAQQALNALPIVWDEGLHGKLDSEKIHAALREGIEADEAAVARQDGDVEAALPESAKLVTAEYYAPYLAHATLEPMNCTARVTAERVEVWAPTQNAEATLAAAARAAGVDPEKVYVHNTFLGGGFGQRGAFQDSVEQACGSPRRSASPSSCCGRAKRTCATTSMVPPAWRGSPLGSTIGACPSPGRSGSPLLRPSMQSGRGRLSRGWIPSVSRAWTAYRMRSPTRWSSTPCATRTFRSGSGAR
jgi:isoquinoline 1-oxidoreductase beta subunit